MLLNPRTFLMLSLPLAIAACGDPLRDVDRLSEVDIAQDAAAATVAPLPSEQADAPGFLSRLLGGSLTDQEPTTAIVVSPDGTAVEAEVVPVGSVDVVPPIGTDMIPGDEEMAAASAPVEPAERRQGIFGLLNQLGTSPQGAGPASTGPDAQIIEPGTTLAYGQIATVCGLRTRDLGRVVGSESGYTVYDTNPASTGQRTHYVTGFDDGCARQFRAALVLFGDVGTHEVIRYSDGTRDLPYSDTDNAYEEIKARVCRVSSGQPCGSALDRLARRTTFLTVYANFGLNPEWADILLSDGDVVAMDFKG
ncbi:hypothetical protein [Flavimaricola marinus]|uniref:Uncharacterized protein n=1 Tax=Flavimaricola marinus TaxID=1819565 RepID=A0A238L8F5_9RHOB|nr:hypothetical protein [Flavimaricola marinus]SMY05987.1 hypothetical protein LOM8899_00108 [Flavimaricola marinus]